MSGRYLTIEDIVPRDFLKAPRSIVVEAGNGQGKTHASVEYSVSLQRIGVFDRIYITEYSQRSCENVVKKIEKFNGKAVWHIGLEKFCPFYSKVKSFIDMGLPASWICYSCPYFQNKSRIAYMSFIEDIKDPNKHVIVPVVKKYGLKSTSQVCTHPIIRSFILDPTMDSEISSQVSVTPIIVVPVQLFFNHSLISRWKKFGSRQRKERKVLLVIDESDTAFYSALKTEIRLVSFSPDDYNLLRSFSPKRKDLSRLLDLYIQYTGIIEDIHRRKNEVSSNDIDKIARIRTEAEELLRSFDRRKKEIVRFVLDNNIRTPIFMAVRSLEELVNIENLRYTLKTVEKTDTGFILYDYDYGVRLLFDVEYPWKYFWKVNLSATLPTESIIKSELISPEAKRILLKIERRSRTYENVYVSFYQIFEKVAGVLNRNEEILYAIPRIFECTEKAVDKYREKFNSEPNGVSLWFGNSKQMKKFIQTVNKYGFRVKVRKRSFEMKYKNIQIFGSYLGSPIARGIDLNQFDISIVIAPLLRPPRPLGFIDYVDFAKAVSEVVQGAMRIVRSPRPDRAKLVVLDSTISSAFYAQFYPAWFKKLVESNYIEL